MNNTIVYTVDNHNDIFREDLSFTNDTPYLALPGELWGVFRGIFKDNDRNISRAHCILMNIRPWWHANNIMNLNVDYLHFGYFKKASISAGTSSQVKSKYVYFSRYIIYAHNFEHRGQNKINALVYHIIYDVHHVTLAENTVFQLNLRYMTHAGRDQMAPIWQTTFLNEFSSMNKSLCLVWISLNYVLKVHLAFCQHWFR